MGEEKKLNRYIPEDPYLSLRDLAGVSGLSVTTLRGYLRDPVHPLPCYRVGRKTLVNWLEFQRWMTQFRGTSDLKALVDEVTSSILAE